MKISKRKSKILSGIGIDTIGSVIAVVVGLIVVPFYFNYISKDQYGTWLAVNGLIALISVVDMGTDQYLATIVADDTEFYSPKIGHVVLSTLIIKLASSSVIVGVAFILYIFISNLLVIDQSELVSAKKAFIIALIALLLTLFTGTISTLLYGRHHFSLVSGFTSISAVISSLSTIFFLALGFEISAFPLAILCAVVIQNTILFAFLYKHYPHVRINFKNFRFQKKKEMINYSFTVQILRWVHIIRSQYVVIAINNLVSPSAAALYNLTNRLPLMVPLFASKIASPFFPSFAENFAKGQIEIAATNFLKVNKLLFRFSIFSAILSFVITKDFIKLWIGLSGFAGSNVLFLLIYSAFIFAAMGVFGIIIFASKNFEKWLLWSIVEIILALILSYVLSFYFDLFGVVFGFVLASMITPLYLFKIVLKQLHLSIREFIAKVFPYAFLTNISTLIVGIIIVSFVEISGWIELILLCITFILIHVLLHEGILMFKTKEIGLKAKLIAVIKL